MDLYNFWCLSSQRLKVMMCAVSVQGRRKAYFASVFSRVSTLHYVARICVSMVMMVMFANPKYSMYSTICSTPMSVAASCILQAAFLTFCDSWRVSVSNGVEKYVIALFTGTGFQSQSMVAIASLVTINQSSLLGTSAMYPCPPPPHAVVFMATTILAICYVMKANDCADRKYRSK